MRDPDRIQPLADTLAELWALMPDLRFHQYMAFLTEKYKAETGSSDLFYEEDEPFHAFLKREVEKEKTNPTYIKRPSS